MSKSDNPPPYTPTPTSTPSPLTSLTTHLTHLPTLIAQTRQTHTHQQTQHDTHLLTHLIPPITALLETLASTPHPASTTSLVLVPSNPVEDWSWAEDRPLIRVKHDSSAWWTDEAQARRLAAHLQPQAQTKRARERKETSEGKSIWGLFKSPNPVGGGSKAAAAAEAEEEEVSMSVRAEEVTFRRENEFGVWESKSGYGIVVVVRMKIRL